MNTICPLCNGLYSTSVECDCGSDMLDKGPVNDYLGPYSPYSPTESAFPACIHLFRCPTCNRDKRKIINRTDIFSSPPTYQ